jgi:hypothetical protein
MRKLFVPMFAVLVLLFLLIVALPVMAFDANTTVDQSAQAATPVSIVRCPGAPAARLSVGMTGRVTQTYSTLWASIYSNAVLDVMYRANGDTFVVLGGPFCGVGPYNWYQVRHGSTVGYVTEGTGSAYWIEPAVPTPTATVAPATPTSTPVPPTATPTTVSPTATATLVPTTSAACPGAPAPRLTTGAIGSVAQVYSSLRAGIGSANVLAVMYKAKNHTFTVLGGPYCGYGPYNWYRVQFGTLTGYVTEGTGSVYWIQPNG